MRTRRIVLKLLAATLALSTGPALQGIATAATVQEFLPDLTPVPLDPNATNPVDVEISTGAHERLHFAFKSENAGAGALELQPKRQDCNGNGDTKDDRTAFQNIYGDTNGNGVYDPPGSPSPDQVVRSARVGCFTFDPVHGHWHFKNYAKYSLLNATGTKVAARSKVGFCLIDDTHVDTGIGPNSSHYFSCADLHVQGISLGWDDVYGPYLSGQSMVIDGIPDGDYCLVERTDPKHVLQELDTTNNTLRTPIQITGTTVSGGGAAC